MLSNTILPFWFIMFMAVACQQTPGSNTIETEPHVIEQVADLIEGKQGESVNFYLGDYYTSESPITSVNFSSDSVSIEPLDGDSFRISQPDPLSGEFVINGELRNEDDQQLNSELTYQIEPKPEPEPEPEPDPDPDTPPSDGTLVIMPLGDSLTNDPRSRVTLWNLLTDDGHELDYVGDQRQSSSIPDDQHEGVGGITIQGIADKAARLMNTHQPEYIFLMVGTNNIAWYFDETAEEIAERWNNLIQIIYDNSAPGTYIIAATIPPVTSSNVGNENMQERDRAVVVTQYNSELRNIISDRKDNGDNIVLADVEDALSLSEHFAGDGVHLNESGYILMGTIYYEAMNSVLWEQYENNE